MTARATTRDPRELAVGDHVYTNGQPATVVKVNRRTAVVRLGSLNFEIKRRDLRRTGTATVAGRVFRMAA